MEKEIKPKKDITTIEIVQRSKKELKELSNSKEFQDIILKNAYQSIKEAIDKKWEKAELFNIINLSIIIEIPNIGFPSALKKISKYFEEKEEYEKCAEIKQLIKKIK
jgi:hypothetical protein|tara:strand:+ start:59 stop:379 length:321 start_codon:yes stop_codon:yes gene_type:complete